MTVSTCPDCGELSLLDDGCANEVCPRFSGRKPDRGTQRVICLVLGAALLVVLVAAAWRVWS